MRIQSQKKNNLQLFRANFDLKPQKYNNKQDIEFNNRF